MGQDSARIESDRPNLVRNEPEWFCQRWETHRATAVFHRNRAGVKAATDKDATLLQIARFRAVTPPCALGRCSSQGRFPAHAQPPQTRLKAFSQDGKRSPAPSKCRRCPAQDAARASNRVQHSTNNPNPNEKYRVRATVRSRWGRASPNRPDTVRLRSSDPAARAL